MADSEHFRTTKRSVVHSWAMFSLLASEVESATGEVFERTFVHTPGAVATVALTPENDIILVSQYRAALDSFVLEIPAGMRDKEGENPEITATRELKEETGYSGELVDFLGEMLSSPGVTDSTVRVYLMRDVVGGTSHPEGPEERAMTVERYPFVQAMEMVESGQIADSKSVFGIMLAARRYPDLLR